MQRDGYGDGVAVDLHRLGDVLAVAAGDGDGDGDPHFAAGFEHHGVAARESVDGEGEAAQRVALVRIGAGQVDDELGARVAQHAGERVRERREIRLVAGAVGQLDVQRARDARERDSSARRAC